MKFYSAEEYQASCKEKFIRYKRQIEKLLPDATIEHIGASSIPMAVSKGDLDIFVGVEASALENAVQQLTTLDFTEKSDTLKTPELCMLESASGDDVAFQVVANGSEFACFLVFRDKLRSDASLVQQYNELKLSCEGWPQEEYRRKKSAFVERVLARSKK
ncbi:GrpB family protein [Vibrio diabolicus]|uniref:GrpB family protein n=1 Tax=Vibrio diabolicus TaxID=50719 RepID=UPI0024955949|nr:GrpB family protein [Vibrio diabolicus]